MSRPSAKILKYYKNIESKFPVNVVKVVEDYDLDQRLSGVGKLIEDTYGKIQQKGVTYKLHDSEKSIAESANILTNCLYNVIQKAPTGAGLFSKGNNRYLFDILFIKDHVNNDFIPATLIYRSDVGAILAFVLRRRDTPDNYSLTGVLFGTNVKPKLIQDVFSSMF